MAGGSVSSSTGQVSGGAANQNYAKTMQAKFNEIYAVANGNVQARPYRDSADGLITAIDEQGYQFKYNDIHNK